MCIVQPSIEAVSIYVKKWKTLRRYVLQESSLKKLFAETYPQNDEMDDVLIKVCSLNDFYSTNIFHPVAVAERIVSLKFDQRLADRDLTLVDDVACVEIYGQPKCLFSFATKYCSHHDPDYYPIYDKFVVKMLMHYKREDKFCKFKKADLRCYPEFYKVLKQFKKSYKLDSCSLKEIDKYLWLAGKDYFS